MKHVRTFMRNVVNVLRVNSMSFQKLALLKVTVLSRKYKENSVRNMCPHICYSLDSLCNYVNVFKEKSWFLPLRKINALWERKIGTVKKTKQSCFPENEPVFHIKYKFYEFNVLILGNEASEALIPEHIITYQI